MKPSRKAKNNSLSSTTKKTLRNAKPKEPENQKLVKSKHYHNYQTKTTLKFSCNHQLCGICVSHLLIEEDFKSLSDNKIIKLICSVCKRKNAEKTGDVETSLEDLDKMLSETEPIRTEKKKDLCEVHNKLAENYCIQCKKWICIDCVNLFHNKYFKEHTLVLEEPFEYKECKVHGGKLMDLFCSDCNQEVCHFCDMRGENHEGHKVITLNEYKTNILKEKKKYRFKNYKEFEEFLNNLEKEFKKQFEESFKKKESIINKIMELFQYITEEYFPKKQEKENFIANYFKVIRWCYFNYFNDLKIKEPVIDTLNFINGVNKELSGINFDSEFTEDLEKIKENIKLINPKKFFKYEMKFTYHTLNCVKTIKEEKGNHIYCIKQLKNGNLATAGSEGVINIWDINNLKKIDYFKAHEGNIYSLIQLNDGRIVSAGADLWIKFLDLSLNQSEPQPKSQSELLKFDIIDQNKLKEYNEKKDPSLKDKNNSGAIILRGKQKQNIINTNIISIGSDNNINNNNNNNDKTVISNPSNVNNINNNTNHFNNTNILSNSPGTVNNIINKTNVISNPSGTINNINNNINQPSDVSYSSSFVNNKPSNIVIPHQDQLNTVFNQNIGFGNAGNPNADTGYSINGVTNPLPPKIPDVAYSSSQAGNIVTNVSDASVPYSSVTNKINNINANNNNINNIVNNEEKKDTNINNINNIVKNDSVIPEVTNSVESSQEPKKKKIKDLKESDFDFDEDTKNEIPPPNPPKNPGDSNEKDDDDNKDIAFSSNTGQIITNKIGKEKNLIHYRCVMELRGHYDDIFCLLETSKKQLVSCSKDGTILIWNIDNHSTIYNYKGHDNSVGCCIELGEDKIVTGGADCKIKIWNISTDPEKTDHDTLKGHKNAIFSICKIDDNTIVSASCDKTLRMWDINQKKCIFVFNGHLGYVWSVVKLKEDNKIVSASSDQTMKIWDIDEKKCINTIKAHKHDITVLTLLTDGKIVSGSTDMNIKIWEC
jgi:WD40 repeat protein